MDIAGFGGSISLGNTNIVITAFEWAGTLENDVIEIPSGFGEGWNHHKAGPGAFRGSVRGKAAAGTSTSDDDGPFPIIGSGASADWGLYVTGAGTLTADSGNTISGSFIYSNFSVSRPHAGFCELSFDVENAGTDLAVVWA